MNRIKFVVEEEEEVTPIENQNDHSPKSSQQTSVANLEFASNVNEQDSGSGVDPLSTIKKPLSRVPLTLEEKKERQREYHRLWYLKKKANPVDPEIRDEKLRQKLEYQRKRRQQLLANSTPEQREQMRLKHSEEVRRNLKKETEEQRKRRLERMKQYNQKRRQQLLDSATTPEQREQRRLKKVESNRRQREKESEEQRQRRLERMKQYNRTVNKRKIELELIPEEREKKSAICRKKKKKEYMEEQTSSMSSSTSSSINLVVDNCESSNTSQTSNQNLHQYFSNDNGMEQIDPEQQHGSLLDHSESITAELYPVCAPSLVGDLDQTTEVPVSTTVDSVPETTEFVPVSSVDSTELRMLTQLDNPTSTDTPTLTTTIISTDLESPESSNLSILTNTADKLFPSQVNETLVVPSSLPTVPTGRTTENVQLAKSSAAPSLPLATPDGASTSWWQSSPNETPNETELQQKQQRKKRLAKLTPEQREHRKIVERNRLLKELSSPESRLAILERWRREREKPLLWPYNLVNNKKNRNQIVRQF